MDIDKVFIVGGAGYVGTVLTKLLLEEGYEVYVYDTFWFWDSPNDFINQFNKYKSQLTIIQGDISDRDHISRCIGKQDFISNSMAVINLASISNDPSSDIDPKFTHSINYNGNMNLIRVVCSSNASIFIQASSSSVYGSTDVPQVTESLQENPLTQYSRLKMAIDYYIQYACENEGLPYIILRPSTVCGYSPRQRLDLVANIFTEQAVNTKRIMVYGGNQYRPSIHIKDMARAYLICIKRYKEAFNNIYNVGKENFTVAELAQTVANIVPNTTIHKVDKCIDNRSYRLCSDKIERELGFQYQYSVRDAIRELAEKIQNKTLISTDKCINKKVIQKVLYG